MPYKDKETQREANKKRMQKVRQGNTSGNTKAGNTGKNVLPITLKDGQVFHPESVIQGDYNRHPLGSGKCMWCGSVIPKTDNCCKPCF